MNAAKDTIRGRLHIDPPAPGEPAASYMHFPADRDLNYFSQLLAERSVLKVSGGQRYRVWEQLPGRANEALDCRVYSYAALCGLFYLGLKLNLLADNIAINPDRLLPAPQQPEENKTFDCLASSLKNRKTEAQAPVTTFAIIRIPMFNRNTSLLAGAMTPAQLQDALAKAQQAYFDLAAGARVCRSRTRKVMARVLFLINKPQWRT